MGQGVTSFPRVWDQTNLSSQTQIVLFIYVECCIDLYISINKAHSLAFCLLLKFKPVIVTGIHSYISYLHSCVYFK